MSQKSNTLLAYLQLMRPANMVTALADIWAGFGIAGGVLVFFEQAEISFQHPLVFFLLSLASLLFYAGGVILNDFFDLGVDLRERPERPIPSGKVSRRAAGIFGTTCLMTGLILTYSASFVAFGVAFILVSLILVYNGIAKKHGFFGPLVMGLCRAFNLLLGMVALLHDPHPLMLIALFPLIHIFGITLISRAEVSGGGKNHLVLALCLMVLLALVIMSFPFFFTFDLINALPFLLLFLFYYGQPLVRALQNPEPMRIRAAVKAGVIALILLNACYGAGFVNLYFGIMILLLFPLSLALAKPFQVT